MGGPEINRDNADSKVIWMEGKLVPYADAKVSVLSHSLHYGTAAFEGIRAYQSAKGGCALFRAEDHMKRFLESIKVLGASSMHTAFDLLRAAADVVKANDFQECYVRPLAYIDDSVRGLRLPDAPKAHIAIAAWNWGKYMGEEGQQRGVRAMTSSFRRPDISTAMSSAKLSAGYITGVLARREATRLGVEEAILLDPQGFVAEGSGENIFMVKDGVLSTPTKGYILPGITRHAILQIARDAGLTVVEEHITRNQLYVADEVFFTGTAVEVTPVREIDHHSIGDGHPGPVTRKLSEIFFKSTRGELSQYRHWLTQV
jgi:branched-chain amino acid aminotransferase